MTAKKTTSAQMQSPVEQRAKKPNAKSKQGKKREELLQELGRRLILTEDFVTGKTPTKPDGTEYGVIIYYNGSVKPVT